ncbi:hypothetical protein F4212_08980 [Candidatus Poribacteria bacterium]|nr:hypothetical protein [Candidatus Poribacteria bacterium]
MTNKTYIYHDNKDSAFTNTKDRATSNTRYYYYDATPNTQLTGIHLSTQNTDNIVLYQGEDSMQDPITEIPVDIEIADGMQVFITFDAHTFGKTDADRMIIALAQHGTNVPSIDTANFYGTMLAFPDGFFDEIVPTRQDRGAGVIELADGTLVQYRGFGGNKWRWKLGAKFVDKQMLDRLDTLDVMRPEFTFAQEPARYPDRIYRCILESPIFRTPYTTQWKGNGYSIAMEIAQI